MLFVQFIIAGIFGVLASLKDRCLVCQHQLYNEHFTFTFFAV